jgi:hypothetical protein
VKIKNGVKNIQTVGYNGTRMVIHSSENKIPCKLFMNTTYLKVSLGDMNKSMQKKLKNATCENFRKYKEWS